MIAIIDHKNGDRRSVRDDLAEEYVACIRCKGRGVVERCTGQMGRLYYDGWQLNSFSRFHCDDCFGKGIWPEASTVSPHDAKGGAL